MFPLARAAAVVGGLTLIKNCGENTCGDYQYCSSHAATCEPCELVCVRDKNNFDQEICETQCQDYIHDKIKHYTTADADISTRDILNTIENLRNLTAVSLSISVVLAIVLILVGSVFWLKRRRVLKREQEMMEKKLSSMNAVANNNRATETVHLPPSTASNTAAPSVITEVTHITRRPEEDSTLEYAYDNEGMVPSPIVRDPRENETIF